MPLLRLHGSRPDKEGKVRPLFSRSNEGEVDEFQNHEWYNPQNGKGEVEEPPELGWDGADNLRPGLRLRCEKRKTGTEATADFARTRIRKTMKHTLHSYGTFSADGKMGAYWSCECGKSFTDMDSWIDHMEANTD